MFMSVVGQAEGTHTGQTANVVIDQCREQLAGATPGAAIVFAADHFDHRLIAERVLEAFPGVRLTGCTSAGEMSTAMGFSQDSIVLTLLVSDTIPFATGFATGVYDDPAATARAAAADALSSMPEPRVCLALTAPKDRNTGILLKTLREELGPGCEIVGGFSGTDFNTDNIYQYGQDGVAKAAVSLLLLGGPIRVATVVSNSWEPVGYKAVVEELEGNRLRRIGGRTAMEFFRNAFGPYAEPLPEMPLAVYDGSDKFYLRSATGYDVKQGTIDIQSSLAPGSKIQLTEATPDRIVDNLNYSFERMMHHTVQGWTPQVGMLFSCASRRWIMGTRTDEELNTAIAACPSDMPLMGFYTFGEICPLTQGGDPRLHNCTMVAVLLGEEGDTEPHYTRAPAIKQGQKTDDLDLIAHKLKRIRESQRRLEMQKESFTNVLRLMSHDLAEANRRISEHNQILEESLTMAQEVQQSLLPRTHPQVAGFDVAGRSIYCDETGGDYLDYLPGPDTLSVVVGDVSGHGVSAALLMTTARALLRMRAAMGGTPRECVTDLNRMLNADVNESGRFLTLSFLRLNPATREMTWVRAGHEPALRYDPSTDTFTELMGDGLALGVVSDYTFEQQTIPPLGPGELLVVYSDGITEAANGDGELYGRERLKQYIRTNAGKPSAEILEGVFADVETYREGQHRDDDETLVVIKGASA